MDSLTVLFKLIGEAFDEDETEHDALALRPGPTISPFLFPTDYLQLIRERSSQATAPEYLNADSSPTTDGNRGELQGSEEGCHRISPNRGLGQTGH